MISTYLESTSVHKVKTKSNLVQWLAWVIPVLAVVVSIAQWFTTEVDAKYITYEVSRFVSKPILFFETTALYFYLHLFTVVPVLALSFDKKVAYYKQWKYLIPAIFIMATLFIVWDVWFTILGVWDFNESYFTGSKLFSLPVEEWLFFFTVPFAIVFIYECLNAYIAKDYLKPIEKWLTLVLGVVLLTIGLIHWEKAYTSLTFLYTGLALLYHYFCTNASYRGRFYLAYLVVWIPFVLVNGVLTGGFTEEPVVVYNTLEFMNIRITSIPLEDSVYNLLLFLGVISIYEHLKVR